MTDMSTLKIVPEVLKMIVWKLKNGMVSLNR